MIELGIERSGRDPRGIYRTKVGWRTGLVVVSELPIEHDTLMLRLFGSGAVLKRAVCELMRLDPDAQERALLVPILLRYREARAGIMREHTREEKEFMTATEPLAFFEKRYFDRGLKEGLEKGRKEGQAALRSALVDLYATRFGRVPKRVREPLRRTDELSILRDWLKVFAVGSEAEIGAVLAQRS